MNLSDWLKLNKVSLTEFARRARIERVQAVWKYAHGHAIPSRPNMMKIFEATSGQVTPNDFYDLNTKNAQACPVAAACKVAE